MTNSVHLNLLERLPTELRHIVYSFLGFPIGTYVWIDCPGPPQCKNTAHDIVFKNHKWPMIWHAHPGLFEIKCKVEEIVFTTSEGLLGGMWVDIFGVNVFCKVKVETRLLGVNKLLRDELLHLLFDQVDVRFPYTLTEPVHKYISISPFAYMRRITLDTCHSPKPTQDAHFDTTSIFFIAAHCPALVQLTYFVHYYRSCPLASHIEDFATACRALTTACARLEYLEYEFPPDAAVYEGSDDDIEDLRLREWDGVVLWAWGILGGLRR